MRKRWIPGSKNAWKTLPAMSSISAASIIAQGIMPLPSIVSSGWLTGIRTTWRYTGRLPSISPWRGKDWRNRKKCRTCRLRPRKHRAPMRPCPILLRRIRRIPCPLRPLHRLRRPVRGCKKTLYNQEKKRHKYLFVHGDGYSPIKTFIISKNAGRPATVKFAKNCGTGARE